MAKQLKLKIKNAQLAEAFKKVNVKSAGSSATKKEEKKEAILAPVEEIEVSETSLSSLSYKEEKPASFVEEEKKVEDSAPLKKKEEPSFSSKETTEKKVPSFASKPKEDKPASLNSVPSSFVAKPASASTVFKPVTPKVTGSSTSYVKPPMPSGFVPKSEVKSHGPKPSSFRSPSHASFPSAGGGYRAGGGGYAGNRPSFPRAFKPSDLGDLKPLNEKERSEEVRKHPPKEDKVFKEFKDGKSTKKVDVEKEFDSRDRQGLRTEDDHIWRKRRNKGGSRHSTNEELTIRPKELKIRLPITIKDLAAEMKLKASQLVSSLFMKGVVLTVNDLLDDETTIQLLGHDFDCEITIDTSEEKRLQITDKSIKQEVQETPEELLVLRNPVVTFMGHVDHGKTSLVDAIRSSNIVEGEAGAITQHIGAFRCHTAVGDLTILDTPGHEAFSAMRSRGAEVTDLVVLVIAGDEGIKTQTIEAISQAKEAKVPIVVAINKADKPGFNPENIYRQLSEHELLPEVWGGQTITVNCSALKKTGIKELLEMLALQAEVLELKANPHTRARGVVIESEMHKGLGSEATVLVQNGTLKIGDAVVFDRHWGRIKTMRNEFNQLLQEAPPSFPVKITGLSGLPSAGSEFIVVKNEKEAKELCEDRLAQHKTAALQLKKAGLDLQAQAKKQEKKVLNLLLRADVQGSLEALIHSIGKISSEKVEPVIMFSGIGEINESDVQLASVSKAVIFGFHTGIESRADALLKEWKVDLHLHDIIYHAVDDVKQLMVALLDKIPQENNLGSALVRATFRSSQLGLIAGCQVEEGIIKRNSQIRVVRSGQVIWKGSVASLKRTKEDVKEVSAGMECGILLQGFSDFKEGDILEAFEITYLTQEL